jgi:asparaginyl-tRNA synthetase
VSSQLHLELYLPAHPRVWTLSPCFRAEPSQSSRHLAEFWMLEAEAAFTSDLGDVMDIVEGSLKAVSRGLLSDEDAGLGGWEVFAQSGDKPRRRVETLAKEVPWTRIAYKEAIDLLSSASAPFKHRPRLGVALQTEHEKHLAQHFGGPVFVTDYPKDEKAFYMLPNADGKTVACFDLLIPEMGELAGGSLREHRLKPLLDVMAFVPPPPNTARFASLATKADLPSSSPPSAGNAA